MGTLPENISAILDNCQTVDELRALLNEMSVEVVGASTTVLYSGNIGSVSISQKIGQLKANPTVRIIDKTQAFELLTDDLFTKAIARVHGVPAADYLEVLDRNTKIPAAIQANEFLNNTTTGLWAETSVRFADAAVGNVRVIAPEAKEDRIFATDELKAILENTAVTSIEGISKVKLQQLWDEGRTFAVQAIKVASALQIQSNKLSINDIKSTSASWLNGEFLSMSEEKLSDINYLNQFDFINQESTQLFIDTFKHDTPFLSSKKFVEIDEFGNRTAETLRTGKNLSSSHDLSNLSSISLVANQGDMLSYLMSSNTQSKGFVFKTADKLLSDNAPHVAPIFVESNQDQVNQTTRVQVELPDQNKSEHSEKTSDACQSEFITEADVKLLNCAALQLHDCINNLNRTPEMQNAISHLDGIKNEYGIQMANRIMKNPSGLYKDILSGAIEFNQEILSSINHASESYQEISRQIIRKGQLRYETKNELTNLIRQANDSAVISAKRLVEMNLPGNTSEKLEKATFSVLKMIELIQKNDIVVDCVDSKTFEAATSPCPFFE